MTMFAAQAVVQKLKENLDLAIGQESYALSYDAAGFPILKVTKGQNLFLKCDIYEASGMVDGLGLPQRVYSPHKMIFICETLATLTAKESFFKVLAYASQMGMKLEVFEGTGVGAAADYAAALALSAKVTEFWPHPVHKMLASV